MICLCSSWEEDDTTIEKKLEEVIEYSQITTRFKAHLLHNRRDYVNHSIVHESLKLKPKTIERVSLPYIIKQLPIICASTDWQRGTKLKRPKKKKTRDDRASLLPLRHVAWIGQASGQTVAAQRAVTFANFN